ncbi:hypothetical protein [Enterococcus sp. AZ072]|uniref:hypothetical protein n=1 Tax=unclassified Enterococcus TaxID=2608891 RepID=UPI003D2AE56D
MKKILLLLVIALPLITGCTSETPTTQAADLKEKIAKLEAENTKLKEEFSNYKKQVANDSAQTETSERLTQEVQVYGMNESVDFGDGETKTAELKIIEATTKQSAFPKGMSDLKSYDTERMVAVKVEYTNLAMEQPFLPYAQYFQAYTKDGVRLSLVNQQIGQAEVLPNESGITQMFWELPVDGSEFNEFEIDFVTGEQRVATFDLEVSH